MWTGFRPSDDPVAFPFNIPGNMYLAGALQRLQLLNSQLWRDPYIANTAAKLAADIKEGIQRFAVVEVDDDGPGAVGNKAKVYAYEVDGRGGQLLDFDDPVSAGQRSRVWMAMMSCRAQTARRGWMDMHT